MFVYSPYVQFHGMAEYSRREKRGKKNVEINLNWFEFYVLQKARNRSFTAIEIKFKFNFFMEFVSPCSSAFRYLCLSFSCAGLVPFIPIVSYNQTRTTVEHFHQLGVEADANGMVNDGGRNYGIFRIFNRQTKQANFSVRCPIFPLIFIQWIRWSSPSKPPHRNGS